VNEDDGERAVFLAIETLQLDFDDIQVGPLDHPDCFPRKAPHNLAGALCVACGLPISLLSSNWITCSSKSGSDVYPPAFINFEDSGVKTAVQATGGRVRTRCGQRGCRQARDEG
jgi:hypothetical protein